MGKFKSFFTNKTLSAVVALTLVVALLAGYVPQDTYAATFNKNFDKSLLPSKTQIGKFANEWQIISKSFPGLYESGVDVSNGWDGTANASYSLGDGSVGDVRMSNTVIGTDVENEFLMYTCIEPRVSWTDILRLNTIFATNNAANRSVPQWPDGGNHPDYLRPKKDSVYKHPVKVQYFVKIGNQEKNISDVITMYAAANDVPNGSIGIGNPLLSDPSDGTFCYLRKFSLTPNSTDVARIQIPEEVYNRFDFCEAPVYAKQYTANLNNFVEIYTGSNDFNYDGGSYALSNDGKTLTWNLPEAEDLGPLDYEIRTVRVNGEDIEMTVPTGVLRSLSNGKVTYYRKEAYQMTYKFSLDVTKDGFVSCVDGTPTTTTSADYAVQVSTAPGNTAMGAELTYKYGPKPGEGQGSPEIITGYLNPNFVKGLLYDLEFQKFLLDSSIPLEGVKFSLERVNGDGSGTLSDTNRTYSDVEISKADGSVKFKDMPWGYYVLKEISLNENDSFQMTYLVNREDGKLPQAVPAVDSYSTGSNAGKAAVGWVIRENNKDGKLIPNNDGIHDGSHIADVGSSTKNRLYRFQPATFNQRVGVIENEPYTAEITLKKNVENYADLVDALKASAFPITAKDDGTVYDYPALTDTALSSFGKKTDAVLKNGESKAYKVILPYSGAEFDIAEEMTSALKKSFVYKQTDITPEGGVLSASDINNGKKIKVAPQAKITATVTNTPVARVFLKKLVKNYSDALAGDEFILKLNSDGSEYTSVVLKHGETSAAAQFTSAADISVNEIIPMEYSMSGATVKAGDADAVAYTPGSSFHLQLGEEYTFTIINQYGWKPYFHTFDSVLNEFSWPEPVS